MRSNCYNMYKGNHAYVNIRKHRRIYMAVAVIMPRQGNTVESCIITKWNKQKGDTVAVGGSVTLDETGVMDLLRNGDYRFLD